jgi:beta-lactamase superfamily II metal-dependent hydrolase
LAAANVQVQRTDQDGTIEIVSDGRRLHVLTAKRLHQG